MESRKPVLVNLSAGQQWRHRHGERLLDRGSGEERRGWGGRREYTGTCTLLLLLSHFGPVRRCATPQTAAHQAPPSLGFYRQGYWSGLPFPSPTHACMPSCFTHVQLYATLWTVAHQAPLSTGFSRQEYWNGLPFPSPNIYTTICKIDRQWELAIWLRELKVGLCNHLEGWDMDRSIKREGIYVHLGLIHVNVWQKPT